MIEVETTIPSQATSGNTPIDTIPPGTSTSVTASEVNLRETQKISPATTAVQQAIASKASLFTRFLLEPNSKKSKNWERSDQDKATTPVPGSPYTPSSIREALEKQGPTAFNRGGARNN